MFRWGALLYKKVMPNANELGPEWLAEKFRKACRRPEERQIGLEVERIGLFADGTSLSYSGQAGHPGAATLLSEIATRHGWHIGNNAEGKPLYLTGPMGKVSLEPGNQLELSALPEGNLLSLARTIDTFERQVDEITGPWGLKWIAVGVNPIDGVPAIEVIPSPRYGIMTDYLGRRDTLGTSMMRLTSSVQINLDYTSEAEAVEMLRMALAVTPVSYALFGNSPVANRQSTGWLSYRQQIWKQTDPDRSGLLPEAFQAGFGFDAYARLAWTRPLMFAQAQDGTYLPANGKSLEEIAAGKLPGASLSESNLTNAVQELFFEARLKPGYVEVRSLDGQSPADRYACSAFWVGLLYRSEARKLALDLLGGLSAQGRERLLDESARIGLDAQEDGLHIKVVSRKLVEAARETLVNRGRGEEKLLEPLDRILESGKNPGQLQLEKFQKSGKPTDPATLAALFD